MIDKPSFFQLMSMNSKSVGKGRWCPQVESGKQDALSFDDMLKLIDQLDVQSRDSKTTNNGDAAEVNHE